MQRALSRFSGTAVTSPHVHDRRGTISGTHYVVIGEKVYRYLGVHCSCGRLKEFVIVGWFELTGENERDAGH